MSAKLPRTATTATTATTNEPPRGRLEFAEVGLTIPELAHLPHDGPVAPGTVPDEVWGRVKPEKVVKHPRPGKVLGGFRIKLKSIMSSEAVHLL